MIMSKQSRRIFIVVQDGRKRKRREYLGGMNRVEMKEERARLAGRRWRLVRFEDWWGNVLDLTQFPESSFFGQEGLSSDYQSRELQREKSSSGEIRDEGGEPPGVKNDDGGTGLPTDDRPEVWDSGL